MSAPDTRQYIGIKLVEAWPDTRKDANAEVVFGYGVRYPDGYESFCPTQQFEAANQPVGAMGFEAALALMKMGRSVGRRLWLDDGGVRLDRVQMATIDAGDASMTVFVRVTHTCDGREPVMFQWKPAWDDLFATDWMLVE